jgi:hypothetical protein
MGESERDDWLDPESDPEDLREDFRSAVKPIWAKVSEAAKAD